MRRSPAASCVAPYGERCWLSTPRVTRTDVEGGVNVIRCCTRTTALSVSLVLLSCSSLFGPDLPEGTVPLAPLPAEYEGWWSLMQRCSGREGRLEDVEWLVLPRATSIPETDGADGIYSERDHAIVLTGRSVGLGPLVRHEMLHALLRDGLHRRSAFIDACGGVVSCGMVCTQEAGVPLAPTPDMALMDPERMRIDVDLVPSTTSLAMGTEGCVTIVVSATNSQARPVRAFVVNQLSQGFSWMVEGVGAGADNRGEEAEYVAFEAGGTRRYTFDCPQPFTELSPGDFGVRGSFTGLSSEGVVLTVVP